VKLVTEGPWKHSELLCTQQAIKLDTTLGGHLPPAKKYIGREAGAEVPPGYHLAFFNPLNPESELSSDGYGNFQSPGPEFPNRMWLGGTVEYNVESALRMGSNATCVESVYDIKVSNKATGDRVSVTLDRVMKNDDDPNTWAVRERRTLIYFSQSSGLARDNTFDRFIKRRFVFLLMLGGF
jgi:hydroxyacyl-ACP dehydratase HTD2-like protein with hotdog domain